MVLNFTFEETKTSVPASMTFTPEFITEFDQAWKFLKDNPGHKATVIFESPAKRDKWFTTAKAYGSQHAEKVFVSKVKGTGSEDKASSKLVFRMEPGDAREKRIAEQQKRVRMYETLTDHGIEYKRGMGSDVDALYAALLKKTPEERTAMVERAKKIEAAKTVKAVPTANKGKHPAKP